MTEQLLVLIAIWLAYSGAVGTAASAGSSDRTVGAVATGGVFLALIASLLVFV